VEEGQTGGGGTDGTFSRSKTQQSNKKPGRLCPGFTSQIGCEGQICLPEPSEGNGRLSALESRAVSGIRYKKDSPTPRFLLAQNKKGRNPGFRP
jgi:hypothetical protein